MTIEIAIVISAISLAFGLYSGISNLRKSQKDDVSKDVSQLTTVIVKLESIGSDIAEIKADLRDVKNDVKDHSMKIAKLEQQVKALEKNVFKDHPSVKESGEHSDEY